MSQDRYGIEEHYKGNYERADRNFDKAFNEFKLGFKKVPKINAMERKILEFCHNRDMKEFLREEFEKHPIKLDENGNLIGENPFDKERRNLGVDETYHAHDPLFESIRNTEIIGSEY